MASAVVLSMVLVGCGSGKDSKKPEIALVTDSGGINDKSFNQSAWEAVKEYGTKNDKGYKYYKPASFDTAGYKDQIKNAVDNGAKVVVLPGFKFAAALGTIQNEKNTRMLSSLRLTSHLLMKKIILSISQKMFTVQLIRNSSQVI